MTNNCSFIQQTVLGSCSATVLLLVYKCYFRILDRIQLINPGFKRLPKTYLVLAIRSIVDQAGCPKFQNRLLFSYGYSKQYLHFKLKTVFSDRRQVGRCYYWHVFPSKAPRIWKVVQNLHGFSPCALLSAVTNSHLFVTRNSTLSKKRFLQLRYIPQGLPVQIFGWLLSARPLF